MWRHEAHPAVVNTPGSTGPVLWRRPWWATPPAIAVVWLVLIVYGSLIPFNFQADRYAGAALLLTSPRWVSPSGDVSPFGIATSTSDLVANLFLYLPLGALLRISLARALQRAWVQFLVAALLSACVSYGLECVQSLSATRVASIQDVLANTLAAALAAAFAIRTRDAVGNLVFGTHRRCATLILPLLERLRGMRKRPGWRAVAFGLALTVAGWLVVEGPTAVDPGLPFEAEFSRPYDVAGVLITQAFLGYTAIAVLLGLCFMRRSPGVTLGRLLLAIAAVTAAINAVRWLAWGLPPNATEPAIAALSVAAVLAAAFTVVHAVRRRCRRHDSLPVAHDRRRRRHDYTFALAR